MKIYIPSASRSDALSIQKGPVSDFSEKVLERTVYIVPNNQVELYFNSLKSLGLVEKGLKVLGCPEKGISATRRWIGETCAAEKFAMVDDDVRFVRRKSDSSASLIKCNVEDINEMWDFVEAKLNKYSHVGISARQGNNTIRIGNSSDAVEENTRTLRVLCYRTDDFLKVEHGRVPVMEDFDVNLQLLRKGLPNLNVGWWSQDQKMTNAPGGCSEYRTHLLHEQSAIKLAELHKGFVSLRKKENKTGGDFGNRTEVTIFWKKAFESAKSSTLEFG